MFHTFSSTVRGIFWMVITGIMFVAVTALVKIMGTHIPAPQAAFIRYAFGLVLIIPMLKAFLRDHLSGRLWRLFALRGFVHTLGVVMWFFAMARIPIADVTAMNYLSPIYVTVGAALFLGEKLAFRRVIAVIVALIGAMIILRPGFHEVSIGHLAMIGTAIFFATSYILAKHVSDRVNPQTVVVMLSLFVTIGLVPFAIIFWVEPTISELLILFCIAFFATAGHYTMTLAFASAPVTVTQPVTFLQLVWAVLLGAVFFDEAIDPYVVLGGGLIISAITFISWREAVLKKQGITPPIPAPKV